MEKLYPYADRDHQTAEGMSEGFTPWDFGRFRPDAIVINLGTNDVFPHQRNRQRPAEAAISVSVTRRFSKRSAASTAPDPSSPEPSAP
jgi:hypothetical protein